MPLSMLKIQEIPTAERHLFREHFDDAYYRDPHIDQVYQHRLRYFGIFLEGQLAGGFAVYEGGKGPLKTWITPPFYPHIGLFVMHSEITVDKLLLQLTAFARSQYVCYLKWDLPIAFHSSNLPAHWHERWTYRLHLRQSESSLLKNIHPTIKSSHQKAIKQGCTFVADTQKHEVMALIRSNLDQKNVRYKGPLLDQLQTYYSEHPKAHYFSTFLGNQRIACNIIYVDNGIAYHLFSAFDRSLALNYANAAHLLGTLLHLKENFSDIHTFDFEGSTVPSIDFYFKRFGGIQCKYPSMYYSRLPLFFKAP